MFNFNSVVDQVATASKTPLTLVEDKAIRANLEAVVDSYVEFSKSLYATSEALVKQIASTKGFDFSKFAK